MTYSLFPEVEREATARASHSLGIGDPSAFSGFGTGVGMYAMRGLAEVPRAIDLLGSVVPVALDKLTGGTERQDQYFREHEEVFQNAVDYWTPKPGEVGAAGQIVGGLVGGLPIVMMNPALAVGSAVMNVGEDLTRQNVDPHLAAGVGVIQGAGLAAGIRMPFLGQTLASRVVSGALGNVAQGTAAAAASRALLKASGFREAGEQFDPFDPTQRSLDTLMGAAFGGLAHMDAKAQMAREQMWTQSAKDALLTLNQAKHLEEVSLPGIPESPFELNKGVKAVQTAMDQMLRGEPVNVEQITQGMKTTPDPAKVQAQAEAVNVAGKASSEIIPDLQSPIKAPAFMGEAPSIETIFGKDISEVKEGPLQLFARSGGPNAEFAKSELAKRGIEVQAVTPETTTNIEGGKTTQPEHIDPIVDTANRIALERPEMRVPTGEMDANGNAVSMTAAEYMAQARETAKAVTADAGLFRTAITCLLGVL